MISLDHLLIEEAVFTTRFTCQLSECKGACCTLPGGTGAPLLDTEVEPLRGALRAAAPYMSERGREELAHHNVVEGAPGSYSVRCVDDEACVFVTYEGDVAKCSLEKAFFAGESTFRKPISCLLFPLRVANFGGPYLYYDVFDKECAPGRAHGLVTNTPLVEFLREPLEQAFGKETTADIIEAARAYREETEL